MKKCDIIIPVWNELESTRECINRLRKYTRYPYRLIVIDNGSLKPASEYLENLKQIFPDLLLIRNNTNLGFVKAVNQGIVASDNPYICLVNNDAYVTQNWLASLIETVESGPRNIGIANPTSNVFGKDSADGGRYQWQELDSCKGFCMLIKEEVVEKIGLFDEIYGIGYFEEKDFCKKAIEAGFICIRSKASFVFHKDRLSFDKIEKRDEIFKRNEAIYNKRWGRTLNLAFVAKREDDLKEKLSLINELLKKGHRVNIFSAKREYLKNLKDHIQIRYIPVWRLFFWSGTLFKLRERRLKKKVEFIIANDQYSFNFFNKFRFFHKADILFTDQDSRIVEICQTKSYQT